MTPIPRCFREDDLLDVVHGDGIDAGEGLVQEHELGLLDQGPGDLQAPSLPPGEGVGLALPEVGDGELVQEGFQAVLPLLLPKGEGLQDGQDVLLHRELAEDRGLLGQVAHPQAGPLVHGDLGDVPVVQEDLPPVRGDEPHHHVEGGGLPCPVGPQEPHDLPLLDLQVHAVHHLAPLIDLGEPRSPEAAPGAGGRLYRGRRSDLGFGDVPVVGRRDRLLGFVHGHGVTSSSGTAAAGPGAALPRSGSSWMPRTFPSVSSRSTSPSTKCTTMRSART
jgi:hypothetical protein